MKTVENASRVVPENATATTGIRGGGDEGASVTAFTICAFMAGLLRPGSMGASQRGDAMVIGDGGLPSGAAVANAEKPARATTARTEFKCVRLNRKWAERRKILRQKAKSPTREGWAF